MDCYLCYKEASFRVRLLNLRRFLFYSLISDNVSRNDQSFYQHSMLSFGYIQLDCCLSIVVLMFMVLHLDCLCIAKWIMKASLF